MSDECPDCKETATHYTITFHCKNKHQWHGGSRVIFPTESPTIDSPPRSGIRMPFGKHKGEMVDDLPLDYIEWLLTNIDNLREELKAELERQVIMKKGGGAIVRESAKITGTKVKFGIK